MESAHAIEEIPIFPLSQVLFPGGRIALRVFEPRYVAMTKDCIRDGTPFGISLIRAGFEAGTPAIPHDIGCSAHILEWDIPAPNLFGLVVRGERCFQLMQRHTRDDGLIIGQVRWIDPPDPVPLPDNEAMMADLLRQIMAQVGEEHFPTPHRFDDAAWVAYRLAEIIATLPERKVALLGVNDPLRALDMVRDWIAESQQDH